MKSCTFAKLYFRKDFITEIFFPFRRSYGKINIPISSNSVDKKFADEKGNSRQI